jgi:adenylate kinase family enzyme
MKIQIIGYCGSGKSTLAKKLGLFYNIPYLHLDNVQFYGDWQERTIEQQNEIVNKFLQENENWIIDGNYSKVSPIRFEISDITIFLNYNRFYCYKMCKRRYKLYKDSHRESCPCKEKFDFEFRKWILFNGRTKKRKQKHLINLTKTSGTKLIFNNVNQLKDWLKEIGCI